MFSTTSPVRPDHVVVVVEENHSYSQIFHSTATPYLHSLGSSGAVFTNAHGIAHPSQPNYLAMFAGTTEGVTDDSAPHTFSSKNLWTVLHQVGKSFVSYSESMPKAGFTGEFSGAYARRHNPVVNFSNVPVSADQPFSAFPTDFKKLPTVSFVMPNVNDDMHDGSVQTGDSWLKKHLSAYAFWAKTHNSLLIVTWDEDDNSAANHVPLLFYGQMVKPGLYSENVNHYSVLRTLEGFYGTQLLGQSANKNPIRDIFR